MVHPHRTTRGKLCTTHLPFTVSIKKIKSGAHRNDGDGVAWCKQIFKVSSETDRALRTFILKKKRQRGWGYLAGVPTIPLTLRSTPLQTRPWGEGLGMVTWQGHPTHPFPPTPKYRTCTEPTWTGSIHLCPMWTDRQTDTCENITFTRTTVMNQRLMCYSHEEIDQSEILTLLNVSLLSTTCLCECCNCQQDTYAGVIAF